MAQVPGEEEEGGGSLPGHNAVAKHSEEILAGSQSQPINHALNKGFRSSRGHVWGGPENSGPKIEVIRPGWLRAQAHACSLSGRLFLLAVASEWSAFFSSRVAQVAQRRLMKSHASPASVFPCPLPWLGAFLVVRFSLSDALAVGQNEDARPFVAGVHITRTNATPCAVVPKGLELSEDGRKSRSCAADVLPEEPVRFRFLNDADELKEDG